MIVKMIQNLESKMFNKDLEETKKSQLKMNNAINVLWF